MGRHVRLTNAIVKILTRFLFLVGCSVIFGCNIIHKQQPFNDVLTDSSGNHQLVIEEVPAEVLPGRTNYYFNALVWRVKQGAEWKEKRRVTKHDFESGINRRREA